MTTYPGIASETRVPFAQLRLFCSQVFQGCGMLLDHAQLLADTLATLFSRANLYPVLFDVAAVPKVAPSDQFGWQRLTLTVPFAVEETA